jgi:hypothetical protein
MPKKKESKTEPPKPEEVKPKKDFGPFPEFVMPGDLPPRLESPIINKAFDELSEEEIAEDLRAMLWPHRKELVDRMLHFARQDKNEQVAERTTSKLVERLYGKIPSTKVELGEEAQGLAVSMRPGIFIREDEIPDGTSRPEGFDEFDEDEAALAQQDAATEEPEDEEEEDDDE